MRDGDALFGITTSPFCTCHRSTTCAGDLPCFDADRGERRFAQQSGALAAERAPRLGHDAVRGVECARGARAGSPG